MPSTPISILKATPNPDKATNGFANHVKDKIPIDILSQNKKIAMESFDSEGGEDKIKEGDVAEKEGEGESAETLDPRVTLKTNLDFSHLTFDEKTTILEVMDREEEMKQFEEIRLEQLKANIRELRYIRFSAVDVKTADLQCARCSCTFGLFRNRGVPCPKCVQKVCTKCRVVFLKKMWLCTICYQIRDFERMAGSWFGRSIAQRYGPDDDMLNYLKKKLLEPSKDAKKNKITRSLTNEETDESKKKGPIVLRITTKTYDKKSPNKSGSPQLEEPPSPTRSPEDRFERPDSVASLNKSFSGSVESLASLYSVSTDVQPPVKGERGEVELVNIVNLEKLQLIVQVFQCRNLIVADHKKNITNPYIKCYLTQDNLQRHKRKSKAVKNNVNPVFNASFTFDMMSVMLDSTELCVSIWHRSRLSRNLFLGQFKMMINKNHTEVQPSWYPLTDRLESANVLMGIRPGLNVALSINDSRKKAEVSLHLKYTAAFRKGAGQLIVNLKYISNLKVAGDAQKNATFCKILFSRADKTSDYSKTDSKFGANPVFNHTANFTDVSRTQLLQSSLELTVWSSSPTIPVHLVGRIELRKDADKETATLWQNMLDRPGTFVSGILTIT